jgi:hypothetical protein
MDISLIKKGGKAVARYISASAMHSESRERKLDHTCLGLFAIYVLFLVIFFFMIISPAQSSEIKDRVAAYVDNEAITVSELEITFADTLHALPSITRMEVLQTMINKIILIREAKHIRLDAPNEDELLNEYIDLKLRAFIRIKEKKLSAFYEENSSDFQGKDFDDVREEIESYLIEKELNENLKEHINNLRREACIEIRLDEQP